MPNLSPEKRKVLDAKRYKARKARAIRLLGGACARCHSKRGLEFDHIRPSSKSFTISSKLAGGRWAQIEAELRKCQLLCRRCHTTKSIRDRGLVDARVTHGSISSYRHCRCRRCREAWNKHSREYRRQLRAKKKHAGVAQR